MSAATLDHPTSADATMPSGDVPAAGGAGGVPLSTLRRGQRAIIRATHLAAEDAALVRAMGMCDCALLTVARSGEPFVVTISGVDGADCKCHRVGGCRIGLARSMAERIIVSIVA